MEALPSSRNGESLTRVVALIDMDCFYCACERALDSSLVGVPMAVVQYNPFQGDGSAGAKGVVSIPAEPVSARIAIRDGKVIMNSAANGSISKSLTPNNPRTHLPCPARSV